jgi:hypothetical protein
MVEPSYEHGYGTRISPSDMYVGLFDGPNDGNDWLSLIIEQINKYGVDMEDAYLYFHPSSCWPWWLQLTRIDFSRGLIENSDFLDLGAL